MFRITAAEKKAILRRRRTKASVTKPKEAQAFLEALEGDIDSIEEIQELLEDYSGDLDRIFDEAFYKKWKNNMVKASGSLEKILAVMRTLYDDVEDELENME